MDGQTAASILKILIFLPMVLILVYISLKVGGSRMMGMSGSRIIKIVEKVPLSNKSLLCIAVIDGKPYVISSTEERIELLMELPEEALERKGSGELPAFKEGFMTNIHQFISRREKP